MGTAMAETLFGVNAPAGRLNMTWYQSDGQLPDIDDYDIIKGGRTYRYFEGKVLYPFGYGKTYTQFAYVGLSVSVVDSVKLSVSFSLKNIGDRKSDEVVQVYETAPLSRVKKPLRQLLGFRRVKDMLPGEERRIVMDIPVSEFHFYDVIGRKMMVEEGCYQIGVGSSSADCRQSVIVQIPGQKPGVRRMEERTAADHYDEYENIYLTEGEFGYTAAAFKGKTGIYKDIWLEMDCDPEELPETAAVEIRLNHDVKLCYFRME